MANLYKFSGYYVFPWSESTPAKNEFGYKWYTKLQNRDKSKAPVYIGFTSLKDARKWCKSNYLVGVMHGWIEP